MKRFRFTLLAVCLVLVYLGWTDVSLYLRNRTPAPVTIGEIENKGAPREWLRVTGGYQDLERAISTSGTLEIDALLVPLTSSPRGRSFRILVESRDPRLLELFRTYHLGLDSVFEQERYLQEHAEEFYGQWEVTGMVVSGLVASGNRDKLMQLARQTGMEVPEDVLFLSEGKEPPRLRGFFFLGVGLLGLIKVLAFWKRPAEAVNPEEQ